MPLETFTKHLIVPAHIADGSALANSTTLTAISPTPDKTIAANDLFLGQVLEVYAAGRFSTTGTPTLTLGVYYGGVAGVALAVTAALTTSSGASNLTWELWARIRIRSLGSSGTAMTTGRVAGITAATAVALMPASAPAAATIDTTAAKALVVGATWGTASASNTITCHAFDVIALS